MKAIYFILPSLLIVGGFIGMALSLPMTGWAVIIGLLLYPTGFSYSEKETKEQPKEEPTGDNNNN